MKKALALCLLSFGLMIFECSKKLDELDPNEGSMSILSSILLKSITVSQKAN